MSVNEEIGIGEKRPSGCDFLMPSLIEDFVVVKVTGYLL
jgi:hypothetical protein